MAGTTVWLGIEGPVARITIQRPEARNALSADVLHGLQRVLAELDSWSAVRVVVLGSEGDAAFCAGGDLAEVARAGPEGIAPGARLYCDLLAALRRTRPVLVARVQGPAIGGGLGLVLACDLAVASTAARFGTPEAGVGLFPMMVLAPLVRHLPPKLVARLAFAGDPLSAEEALRWGLVNEVVPPAELDRATDDLVRRVLRSGPQALIHGRRALQSPALPPEQGLEAMREALLALWKTGEAEAGIRAFLEKRPPPWQEGP